MNAAAVGGFTPATTALPPTGLAALAVRSGRALERWGRARMERRMDRDLLLARRAAQLAADAAVAERDELIRRSGYLPL